MFLRLIPGGGHFTFQLAAHCLFRKKTDRDSCDGPWDVLYYGKEGDYDGQGYFEGYIESNLIQHDAL